MRSDVLLLIAMSHAIVNEKMAAGIKAKYPIMRANSLMALLLFFVFCFFISLAVFNFTYQLHKSKYLLLSLLYVL